MNNYFCKFEFIGFEIIKSHPVKKYPDNVNSTIIIESDGVSVIELSFSELSLDLCYDNVTITFEGSDGSHDSITFPDCTVGFT